MTEKGLSNEPLDNIAIKTAINQGYDRLVKIEKLLDSINNKLVFYTVLIILGFVISPLGSCINF